MPMRAGRVLTRRATLWALAGVWLLTERVCFVGVLCFSRRGTVAVFHVLSNTHIQLKNVMYRRAEGNKGAVDRSHGVAQRKGRR